MGPTGMQVTARSFTNTGIGPIPQTPEAIVVVDDGVLSRRLDAESRTCSHPSLSTQHSQSQINRHSKVPLCAGAITERLHEDVWHARSRLHWLGRLPASVA
jgi:hypothetical protein